MRVNMATLAATVHHCTGGIILICTPSCVLCCQDGVFALRLLLFLTYILKQPLFY